MHIKILGTGCPNCIKLAKTVKEIVEKNNIDADITKVDDIVQITRYGVARLPAIVINEKVVIKGRIPSEEELLELFTKK